MRKNKNSFPMEWLLSANAEGVKLNAHVGNKSRSGFPGCKL